MFWICYHLVRALMIANRMRNNQRRLPPRFGWPG